MKKVTMALLLSLILLVFVGAECTSVNKKVTSDSR